MKRKLFSTLKLTLIYVLITFALVEGVLWVMGYRPYHNNDYRVVSSPKDPYIADEKLGIQLNEGVFNFVLNEKIKFTATHDSNGNRVIPSNNHDSNEKVVFLGCSYTYGYGVNDNESYPAITQEKHPEWNVQNTAVVGYGTAQHLLQLRELLENDSPVCVILGLSSVHFIRTVLSQKYRAHLKIGYKRSSSDVDKRMDGAKFPFFDDCSGKVKYASWNSLYSELSGRYLSASINFVQGILERNRESKNDPVDVTAAIIKEMQTLCKEKGVAFGVACLDTSKETKALKRKLKDVAWNNIGFSFKQKKYTHLPYDSHPNANGHEKIAASVIPFIEKLMDNE